LSGHIPESDSEAPPDKAFHHHTQLIRICFSLSKPVSNYYNEIDQNLQSDLTKLSFLVKWFKISLTKLYKKSIAEKQNQLTTKGETFSYGRNRF